MRPVKELWHKDYFVTISITCGLVLNVVLMVFSTIPMAIWKASEDWWKLLSVPFISFRFFCVAFAMVLVVLWMINANRICKRIRDAQIAKNAVRTREFYVKGIVLARSVVAEVNMVMTFGERFTLTVWVDENNIMSFTGRKNYKKSLGMVEGQELAVGVKEWYDSQGDVIKRKWTGFEKLEKKAESS